MPSPDLFSHLGIKVINDFLSCEYCDHVWKNMSRSVTQKATVIGNDRKEKYDNQIRNTKVVNIDKEIRIDLGKKLIALQPSLETFFNMTFNKCQGLQFLSYDSGHFFKRHRDEFRAIGTKDARKVTVIVFLNAQSNANESLDYEGGDLWLYGLIKAVPNKGFLIPGKKGLLVAFKSNVSHEVSPIIRGNRCSLVSWFL